MLQCFFRADRLHQSFDLLRLILMAHECRIVGFHHDQILDSKECDEVIIVSGKNNIVTGVLDMRAAPYNIA